MSDIDWTKAPEGAEYGRYVDGFTPDFYKTEGRAFKYWDEDSLRWMPCGFRSARDTDMIRLPLTLPWLGDGPPPVGTVCTHMSGIERFRVFAVDGAYAAIASEYMRFWCSVDDLRPIKSQAQIAAEQRQAAVKAMRDMVIRTHPAECPYCTLYDAGLRFPKGDDQ